MVEPDRGFNHLQAVLLCQAVHHLCGGDGFYNFSFPTPGFNQVLQREGHDAMRVDELAAAIHSSDAIRIAVGGQSQLPMSRSDGTCECPKVKGDRFGMDAAETWVHLTPDFEYLTASALQDAFYLTPS